MKDFDYIPIHNGSHYIIGNLVHKTYDMRISIYTKVFYVSGSQSSMVPLNKKLLKRIKRIQNEHR